MMGTPSIVAGRAPASGVPVRLALFGDERLARLVGSGSERAFAAIYDRYHQRLYRYCRSIVREDADAQDALQSTLANAFAALKRGQRDAPLRPWLYRIAHNEAISLIRRRPGAQETTDACERFVGSAEDRADERARFALLVADLQALPDRQRGALVMRELGGLSHQEIAIALGISVGGAKQAILEARRALVEIEEGRSTACEDVRRTVSEGDRRALRARRVRAHLRDCAPCAAFAASIGARRDDLQALVPVLAPAASAAMLARVLGAGPGHGAGAGTTVVAAGAASKSVGAAVAIKALVGAAVLVTAAAGVTGVRSLLMHNHNARPPAGVRNAGTTPHRVAGPAGQPAAGAGGSGAGARSSGNHVSHAALSGQAAGTGSSDAPQSASRGSPGSRTGIGGSGVPSQAAAGAPGESGAGGQRSASNPGVGGRGGAPPASIPTAGDPGAPGRAHPVSGSGPQAAAGAGAGSVPSTTPPTTGASSASGAGSVAVNAPSTPPAPTPPVQIPPAHASSTR